MMFHDQEPSAPTHDQITTVVPSFSLLSRGAYEGVSLLVAMTVGHRWKALVVRKSWCPPHVVDY